MKKISFLIPTIDRLGGAERQVLLLASGLLKRGWRVNVIALSGNGGEAARRLMADGAGFNSLAMRKGLADPCGWVRLHGWLRRESPDVIHAHLPHAAFMARASRIVAPSRVVIDTIHTSATGPLIRRLGYRCSNWLPDRITAVSQGAADACLAAGMTSAARLQVLPNGIDAHAWQPDPAIRASMRQHLGLGHEFLWIAIGRLDPVKDYPTLLRAMAQLPARTRLVIAGSGPLDGELLALSAALGLESRVRFLGFEPDVRRWMQAADGFVLSSRWEGLPMSLLEASACALPAVATDVPGSREIVVDGQTGFLAAPGNATSLTQAMTRTMQLAPADRCAIGLRAQQRVLRQFSLDAVLDQWEALYDALLRDQPRPARRGNRN